MDDRFLHASWAFPRVLGQCGSLRSLGFGIETRATREGPWKVLTCNVGLECLGSGRTRFVKMDVQRACHPVHSSRHVTSLSSGFRYPHFR